jgi:cell division protein FtsB
MAKTCPICEHENPSSVNFCGKCGASLADGKLPDEIILRKELEDAKETIALLKKSLATAWEQIENSNSKNEIQSLQKLIATKTNKVSELNAQITKLTTNLIAEQQKTKGGSWGWLFVVLFIVTGITAIVLCVNFSEAKSDLYNVESNFNSQISALKQKNEDLTIEKSSLLSKFDDLSEKFPLKINRIEFSNVYKNGTTITDFGGTLYSSNIRYLKPKIYFTNYLKEGKTFNFTINYYNSHGYLQYNTSNGNRPTSNTYISTTDNSAVLSGWGNENDGTWSTDVYTIEIWTNGVCLGSKKFTIY